MHMLGTKDMNSVELETVRVSRNPTTGITANGEVQTLEEATVYVHDLEMRQFYHLENSANITDTPMSGPVVKNHIPFKTVNGARVTS